MGAKTCITSIYGGTETDTTNGKFSTAIKHWILPVYPSSPEVFKKIYIYIYFFLSI